MSSILHTKKAEKQIINTICITLQSMVVWKGIIVYGGCGCSNCNAYLQNGVEATLENGMSKSLDLLFLAVPLSVKSVSNNY